MNYLLVFIAVFAIFFAVGMFWFSLKGFGKIWMKENKITLTAEVNQKEINKAFLLSFIFRFVQVFMLVCIISILLKNTSLIVGVLLLMGVVSIPIFDNFIWGVRSFKAVLIDFSYFGVATFLSFIAYTLIM